MSSDVPSGIWQHLGGRSSHQESQSGMPATESHRAATCGDDGNDEKTMLIMMGVAGLSQTEAQVLVLIVAALRMKP